MGRRIIPEELMTPRQKRQQKYNRDAHARLKANPEQHQVRNQKQREYNARYRKENPDRVEDSRLRFLYGVSLVEVTALDIKQGGCCALCHLPFGEGALKRFLDHDHKTTRVRGLLHSQCNTYLGILENEKFRQMAEQYLRETQ
jgi:phage-related minor tail protein